MAAKPTMQLSMSIQSRRFKLNQGQVLIPALFGLVIALLIMLIRPDLFPALAMIQPQSPAMQTAAPQPVYQPVTSYAQAVNKAAPSVVNIFTPLSTVKAE